MQGALRASQVVPRELSESYKALDLKPDGGGACQQPIFAAPESSQKVVCPGSGSGSASGTRPRVQARVE
eukprot:1964884-Pyramimonas_sp.AAC.1